LPQSIHRNRDALQRFEVAPGGGRRDITVDGIFASF